MTSCTPPPSKPYQYSLSRVIVAIGGNAGKPPHSRSPALAWVACRARLAGSAAFRSWLSSQVWPPATGRRAARIARQIRSGVAGMSMSSTPSGASASRMALITVGGALMQPA